MEKVDLGGGYFQVSILYYGKRLERTYTSDQIEGFSELQLRKRIIKYHKNK